MTHQIALPQFSKFYSQAQETEFNPRGSDHFLGFKILYCNIFGVVSEKLIFLGSFLCILGSFLKANVQNRDIFLGCKNFKYT